MKLSVRRENQVAPQRFITFELRSLVLSNKHHTEKQTKKMNRLGAYEVVRCIGKGSYGEVYLVIAEDARKQVCSPHWGGLAGIH